MRTTLKFLLFAYFLAMPAYGWPPEIAPEFNFSNAEINRAWLAQENRGETSNSVSFELQEKFRNLVAKRCRDCVITQRKDQYGERVYRVRLKNGWYFEITLDPAVIEVKAKPLRADKVAGMKKEMDRLIWGVAKDLGLEGEGSGHLNFGLRSTFGEDSLLFHNFIADYLNNPGLSQGVLGSSDWANAPHPEELGRGQASNLRRVLREFDPKKHSANDLALKISEEVYFKSTIFSDPEKFQAVNITSVAREGSAWQRVELRAIPMQKDARQFELMANLFVARVEHLKKNKDKVVYRSKNFREQTVFDHVKDLYVYVTESGLDWAEYRQLVSSAPNYQLALEGLDFYIEKGGMKPIVGCAKSFGAITKP